MYSLSVAIVIFYVLTVSMVNYKPECYGNYLLQNIAPQNINKKVTKNISHPTLGNLIFLRIFR